MALDKSTKEEVTKKFQRHKKDTGSADVQIGLLTEQIVSLQDHLKRHPNDHVTRLKLIIVVGQRRKLLLYLNSTDTHRYHLWVSRLKLRK